MDDPFNVLRLQWGKCTEADVSKAYRKLALQNHPDKAGPRGQERMSEINTARDQILQGKLCSKPPPAEQRSQDQRPKKERSYGERGYERPSYGRSSYDRPSRDRPSSDRPSYDRPSYERPSDRHDSYEQRSYSQRYKQRSPERSSYQQRSYRHFSDEDNTDEDDSYDHPTYEYESYEYEQPSYKEHSHEERSYEQRYGRSPSGYRPSECRASEYRPYEQRSYEQRSYEQRYQQRPQHQERQQTRRPSVHTEPRSSRRPQSTSERMEEEFWRDMPSLMSKVRRFLADTRPVYTNSERTPRDVVRDYYDRIQSRLLHPFEAGERERICSLIGSMFFAIKQHEWDDAETDREKRCINKTWSLKYTMSELDWCVYQGDHAYDLEAWLLWCMPEIEREWNREKRIWDTTGEWGA